ncbi:MAG: hypothetical protein WBG11_05290 [Methylocella sp.]
MAEVASHRYSDRKDELAAVEQEAIQRRHDEDMARVQHDTAEAVERAAKLEKETAVAQKEAAEARAEQERLKQNVQWRTLTPPSFDRLVANLTRPKGSVRLAYQAADPEALYVAIQISKAFEQSTGWAITSESRTYPDRLYFGFFIPGPDNDVVKSLRNAFTKAGIPFSTEDIPPAPMMFGPQPGVPMDAVIFVGSKRPPV